MHAHTYRHAHTHMHRYRCSCMHACTRARTHTFKYTEINCASRKGMEKIPVIHINRVVMSVFITEMFLI